MVADSNLVIYSVQPQYEGVRRFFAENAPSVAAATYVEVLGFHRLTPEDKADLEAFFAATTILPVTRRVLDVAVTLRQQRKMTLGDSLVAAACLVYNLPLATHNTADFIQSTLS